MAACPAITWTSAPKADTSSPRRPRSDGNPYELIARPGGRGNLNWDAVSRFLEPAQQLHRLQPRPARGLDLTHLARWVASQPEGNRNAGLFWAANRALDADHAADLSPLAVAARQAGLGDKEITRTLDSARRTGQNRDHQAEAVN